MYCCIALCQDPLLKLDGTDGRLLNSWSLRRTSTICSWKTCSWQMTRTVGKSDVKHQNILGCLDQYTAPNSKNTGPPNLIPTPNLKQVFFQWYTKWLYYKKGYGKKLSQWLFLELVHSLHKLSSHPTQMGWLETAMVSLKKARDGSHYIYIDKKLSLVQVLKLKIVLKVNVNEAQN